MRTVRARFLLAAATLAVAIIASTAMLRSPALELSRGARLAVSLVPVVVAMWATVEYVRLVRLSDEFVRRVMLESLAVAYPVALLIGLTIEYLQKGGFLLGADVGRVWPAQMLVWVVAYAYAHRRYR